jgi:23S rRNA (adenine2030-N6)-methyltransferase
MLSYLHGFHAGNFADVLKHLVLSQTLVYLKQKDKPLCYIDTHAGRGLYWLNSAEAQKNREYLTGIGRFWEHTEMPGPVAEFLKLTEQFNISGQLNQYPGSPLIAAHLLGTQDRLICFELHPKEYNALNALMKSDKRVKVNFSDGLIDVIGLIPPKERRGMVLIDPSYELKTDYQSVIATVSSMYKRFTGGCYLLWYPVVDRKKNRCLERDLIRSGIKNIQLYELGIRPDNKGFGMTASGMIVINPPWTLKAIMQQSLPWLAEALAAEGQGAFRIEQLVEE